MNTRPAIRRVSFVLVLLAVAAVAKASEGDVAAEWPSAAALLQEAERGDGQAQTRLADLYAAGHGVAQDFEQAALWRERAAAQSIAAAENALGKQYAAGLGVPQDSDKALSLLQRAAGNDDPAFWFDLAVFFEQLGGEGALEDAVKWHRRAADAGHVAAHAHLGLLYYNGEGIARDLDRAAQLLTYAAEHGHPRAQNNLGLMFTRGQGVEQDYDKAIALFQRAVDQGLKEAYTNLGVMYENGFGVDFDEDRAAELYRQAQLQNSLEGALQSIGFLADPRIVVDISAAADLRGLLRQAKLGDAIAQYQCGYLLLGQQGVAPDYATAADMFGKAAGNGISTAMTNLGLLYFRGLGVPQDYVLGLAWLSIGANSGRETSIAARDLLMNFLTASQINEAQTIAREFVVSGPARDRQIDRDRLSVD